MTRTLPRPSEVPGAVFRELRTFLTLSGERSRPDQLWYVDETGYPILAVELEPGEADALRRSAAKQEEATCAAS